MSKTIRGTYGSGKTPCNIFVRENFIGTSWYCVEGSRNVNLTWTELLVDGIDVETLEDMDYFYTHEIWSDEQLEAEVEEYENG